MKGRKNKKGFTLIELLAVIVILGLLMAIAIPSVTKYITESRKKTLTTTVGNYIGALVNEVNDLSYTFTGQNTIYAVPIECIALERGGTNPFGEWYQASNSYWAYVLVQYDDTTSKYIYGFTFKDSAGYGLYPTIQANIKEKGSQIKTGYSLTKPTTGTVTNIATIDKWNGFDVDTTTNLVVLEATSDGEIGNGKETCTLAQKGNNYSQVEEEKENRKPTLANLIKKHNTLITAAPILTNSSNNTSDASGLYSSTDTNSGQPTYYFRGNVTNNYVSFAGLNWRIIRINEDGTVRLILNSRIGSKAYKFNSVYNSYLYMYYSKSNTAKPTVDSWYKTNIADKGYGSYVATGIFCEQAKVGVTSGTSGSAIMDDYTTYKSNFYCDSDGNKKGVVNSKVGLITIDEVIHAGGYFNQDNSNYYLYNGSYGIWTMSPANFYSNYAFVWLIGTDGYIGNNYVTFTYGYNLRPVINLNADVLATGTGTSSDPYVVQTN